MLFLLDLSEENTTKFINFVGLPSTVPSAQNSSTYLIEAFLSYNGFTTPYSNYLAATAKVPIPYTYKQASTSSEWLTAMKLELDALENNNTWELVPRLPNQHVVDCKWIFKIKHLPDGSI